MRLNRTILSCLLIALACGERKMRLTDCSMDADGDIWAREWHLVENVPHRWHVFDSTGAWIGDMQQPDGGTVNEIGHDWMTVVRSDQDGVVHAYLYHINRINPVAPTGR